MKKLGFVLVLLFALGVKAQVENDGVSLNQPPIPVELFAGDRAFYYQHVISKDLKGGKYNFFNVSSFDADYDREKGNNYIISSFLSRNLGHGFSVGIGGEMQNPGAFVYAGAQYSIARKNFLLVLFPTITLNKISASALFSLLEFRPMINDNIGLYFRFQGLVDTNYKVVHRSYQQFRAGIMVDNVQFGFAMNFDQFDDARIKKDNYGAFVRMQIF